MTGISEANQHFYSGSRYTVKQAQNAALASDAEAIDLSSVDYEPGTPFTVWVGGTAGAIKIDTKNGSTVTIGAVPAGSRVGGGYGIVCTKVYKTGTTATSLVALS